MFQGQSSLFDSPQQRSPAPLSPGSLTSVNDRHARLSLPAVNTHAPSPLPGRRPVQRAETLPGTLEKDGHCMASPTEFLALLQSMPQDVLLLDLRVAPQYLKSRIRGALNLCIPTTLIKRPSFNVQKLTETFTQGFDRESFSRWRKCTHIAIYDVDSNSAKDSQGPKYVLQKFMAEGWKGQGVILNGGFQKLSQSCPAMIDHGSISRASGTAGPSPSGTISAQSVAPVAGGCPMPASKSPLSPFFNTIRQNMELRDGVGQLPVHQPLEMREEDEGALPAWLKRAASSKNAGRLVSDAFLSIERAEQTRMQDALRWAAPKSSPSLEGAGKIQIAGIEKGAKNRYNNIFPYDHSRVHLQNSSPGTCDYINANHVKASYSNKHYIATQAPLPATFNDFWRLVWEQNTRVIVMLTAESEGGQMKSHPYWNTGEYGPLKLQLLGEKRIPLEVKRDKRPKGPKSPGQGPSVIVRNFMFQHSHFPFQAIREVTQLHYTQWPDFGAPAHPQDLLALVEKTNKHTRAIAGYPLQAMQPEPAGQPPVLVHCSAGCGRTGTFCTVDSVLDMMKRQKIQLGQARTDLDPNDDVRSPEWIDRQDMDLVARTVEEFREQRLSMVQSLRQFVLCYESVLDWWVEDNTNNG